MKTEYIIKYRTPEPDELILGFSFERLTSDRKWIKVTLPEPTPDIVNLYLDLLAEGKLRVAYFEEQLVEEEIPKENVAHKLERFYDYVTSRKWFKASYSAIASVGFFCLFYIAFFTLDWIDTKAVTSEGNVLPSGLKALELVMWALALHSGGVIVSNLIHWGFPGSRAYTYINPYLKRKEYDKYTDLNNLNDPAAKYRLSCHTIESRIFYFVSIGFMVLVYLLKMWLQQR